MPRHTTDHYASDKKPPATLTTIIKRTPRRARESPTRPIVVAPDLLVEVDPLFGVEVGALGTNVPVAEARHELATAAADAVEALSFTVPLPAKLHCWALRLFAS